MKWKNVSNKEGRQNYRRLRNELKRATYKFSKKYLDNICDKVMEIQRTGRYILLYMKMNWVGKKTMGFKTLALKTLKGI